MAEAGRRAAAPAAEQSIVLLTSNHRCIASLSTSSARWLTIVLTIRRRRRRCNWTTAESVGPVRPCPADQWPRGLTAATGCQDTARSRRRCIRDGDDCSTTSHFGLSAWAVSPCNLVESEQGRHLTSSARLYSSEPLSIRSEVKMQGGIKPLALRPLIDPASKTIRGNSELLYS